jgi:hypothetical protein
VKTPENYRHHPINRSDIFIALALLTMQIFLLISSMNMGITRDEGYYFHAAEDYWGWFESLQDNLVAGNISDSFTQDNIDHHWANNPEHPVFMKTLFGFSWDTFHKELEWFSPITAMRLPSVLLSALLIFLLYLFGVEAFGSRMGATFGCLTLILMPRYFFHAHLACFDSPITTLWFATIYAYWKSLEKPRWAIVVGLTWGISLIIKLNGFFIPIVLLLHWIISGWRSIRWKGPSWRGSLRLPQLPRAFWWMAVLGPLIFYLFWPRHWFDTFSRVLWYFNRHLSHEHYFVNHFNEALVRPPFSVFFPVVMTLISVPLITLLLSSYGAWVMGRGLDKKPVDMNSKQEKDTRSTGILIALNIIIPIAIISMPDTPVFGGTKHWMQSMPFLSLLCCAGFAHLISTIGFNQDSARWKQRSISLLCCLFLCAPMAHATFSTHPHGITYYNTLIGGVRGAADRNLMRQYWGYSTIEGLSSLEDESNETISVFPHNANSDAMEWYQREGLLSTHVRNAYGPDMVAIAPTATNQRRVPEYVDYAFYNHQRAFIPVLQEIWAVTGTYAPTDVWDVNGVPVLSLYADESHRSNDN